MVGLPLPAGNKLGRNCGMSQAAIMWPPMAKRQTSNADSNKDYISLANEPSFIHMMISLSMSVYVCGAVYRFHSLGFPILKRKAEKPGPFLKMWSTKLESFYISGQKRKNPISHQYKMQNCYYFQSSRKANRTCTCSNCVSRFGTQQESDGTTGQTLPAMTSPQLC